MARLLQVFGFLSVLFRGATLSFQSLTIGGITFLTFVSRRLGAESESLERTISLWIRRFALALAAMQIAYVASSSMILIESADISIGAALSANFAIAGALSIAAGSAIAILAGAQGSRGHFDLLLPAMALIVASVMTSHAMARLDYRLPLALFTALHQGATAIWLGGLFYLLIGLRQVSATELARKLTARFSQLALISVLVLGAAGLMLGYAYVGSVSAIYGTSYGIMVATKAVLFGLLLFLGALNFQLVRSSSTAAALASIRRFGEAEIGIGLTVIFTAASLTSLPPAADLREGRVTSAEISERLAPRSPRFSSPSMQDLPEDIYAAQQTAIEAGALSAASFVPGQAGTRPNTVAEKSWSEYNHHWAGIIVCVIGMFALLAEAGKIRWARNWPLIFLGLALFLFLRSDPEVWPLGPNGFWVTFADPEVLLHRIFVLLVIGLAVFEWRVQTDRVSSPSSRLIFPGLIAVASALLLTHSHSLGNIKEEVLAEVSHAPLAILGVTAGWSRWLEIRLPAENRVRTTMGWLWPACFLLIGALLLNYREM